MSERKSTNLSGSSSLDDFSSCSLSSYTNSPIFKGSDAALRHQTDPLTLSPETFVRRQSRGPELFGSARNGSVFVLTANGINTTGGSGTGSSTSGSSGTSTTPPSGSLISRDSSFASLADEKALAARLAEATTETTFGILRELPKLAEFSSYAHRACLPVLQFKHEDSGVFRKTSIICTIGPQTNTPQALADLRRAGMNIMRMNFSHGDHAYHASAIENLRRSFELYPGPPVAVALDTKGPEIRTGLMREGLGEVELLSGSVVKVTTDPAFKKSCDSELIYVDYTNICKVIEVGSTVYIDDGLISLRVLNIASNLVSFTAEVLNNGKLSSKKGVNLPGCNVDLPSVSEQDAKDLLFGAEQGVDMIFASFMRKKEDIRAVRAVLSQKEGGKRIMIIAKIENQEGLNNFDAILKETDGVMVARGDLGIEIPAQKVFVAQKMMIAKCNIVGKPVICATQMLESMTYNPRPTRAEVSDVANAVIDGADCVMLSGETAKGKYPYECVRMMHDTCLEAESTVHFRNHFNQMNLLNKLKPTNETLAAAAVAASFEQNVSAVIVLTVSGSTARAVAKYRPSCPIIVITTDEVTSRQMHLTRGTYPVFCPLRYDDESNSVNGIQTPWNVFIDQMVSYGIKESLRRGVKMLQPGDLAIVVQGWTSKSGHTNTLRVIRV